MNRKGLILLIILTVVFGCVERKYDEENYPVVMEVGSDVVDNQDVYEEEDTIYEAEDAGEEEKDVEEEIEDAGGLMDQEDLDQFVDIDEEEIEYIDVEPAESIEDIETTLGDPDSTIVDSGNPKYPPCGGVFAKSCKHRCAYNANCPCQCDKACTKAKDCCKDMDQFCSEANKPEDKDVSFTVDTAQPPQDTWQPPQDTNKPEDTKPQLGPGECPKDCKTWYDGCNTCQCDSGKIGGCTKMGCPTKKEPYCKKLHGT